MERIDNLLEVTQEYADDPMANSIEYMPASKVAEMFPNLAGIILHPDFTHLCYIIEVNKVTIEWREDVRYDDGQDVLPLEEQD